MTSEIWAVYTSGVGFLLNAIFAFSSNQQRLVFEPPMGIALAMTSFFLILTGAAGTYKMKPLRRAFHFILATIWIAKAIFYLSNFYSRSYAAVSAPERHGLLPGYVGVIILFVLLCSLAVAARCREILFLSLCFLLAGIFETSSMWRDLLPSAGACYIILASITACVVIQDIWKSLYKAVSAKQSRSLTPSDDEGSGRDYVTVCQALNVLSSATYVYQTFAEPHHAKYAFFWFAAAALVQLICSMLLVRQGNPMYAGVVGLSGAVWLNVGYSLSLQLFANFTSLPLVAIQICLILVFVVISAAYIIHNVFLSVQSAGFLLIAAVRCADSEIGMFVACWFMLFISLYGMASVGLKSVNFAYNLPLGLSIHIPYISDLSLRKRVDTERITAGSLSKMGYTKYADYSSVGFLSNALAALAIAWSPKGLDMHVLPWTFGIGGVLQMAVASISFSRGYTFESCSHFVMAAFWSIWGPLRATASDANDIAEGIECVSFIAVCVVMIGLAATVSRTWIAQWFLFLLVVISHLLRALGANGHTIYASVVSIAFAVSSLYSFAASITPIVPNGKPLLRVSYLHTQSKDIIWASAIKSSGVNQIAEILNKGGIVGLPTDTVYILVAACKHPEALKRLYETKKQAAQRPMSLWISSLEQIATGRGTDFSALLWDFMRAVWPSSISLVVSRGQWVNALGMGDSAKYVGKPDSIAVRMPDTTVINHLINMTGPIAVTSANPTGEADTTHHLQVLAKLGARNCDAILCDGSSAENIASTVVDCRKIDEHILGYFRVGLVPKSRVGEIFDATVERHLASSDRADLASYDSGVDARFSACGYSTIGTIDRSFIVNELRHMAEEAERGAVNQAFVDDVLRTVSKVEVHRTQNESLPSQDHVITNYGSISDHTTVPHVDYITKL